MWLIGAGSSAPFGIPTMKSFVDLAEVKLARVYSFLSSEIREAVENSVEYLGVPLSYDLESLMAVLEDLAEGVISRPPTFAFIYHLLEKNRIKNAKEMKSPIQIKKARDFLFELKRLVNDHCWDPIKDKKKEILQKLDLVYGPLFEIGEEMGTPMNNYIFTTNWDLCLQEWLDYRGMSVNEGTQLDPRDTPVLRTDSWGRDDRINLVPLHGSLGFVEITRTSATGEIKDVVKVSPRRPLMEEELRNVFIIYPLEAIGFEKAVTSPYLDLLGKLKERLRYEDMVFVVGFSFRNKTINSIFEEILREKYPIGRWAPIEGNREERIKMASDLNREKRRFTIFLLDPNPDKILDTVERSGFRNLNRAIVPIKAKIPCVDAGGFYQGYSKILMLLMETLQKVLNLPTDSFRESIQKFREKWHLPIPTDPVLKELIFSN